ncbi:helix-turn-helix transcriptional regulator [Candidatus Micrarchaeota archaeon]|nr:helix-turn-helix transcriptional regulator [Candidatus Micrarchaeota archaeon]
MNKKEFCEKSAYPSPTCPVELTLRVLGGKWKLLIIYHLSDSPKRFSELRKSISSITEKMLSSQLKELERDHIVSRKVYPVVPPKVEYTLTEYGRTLNPLLELMARWGQVHKDRILTKNPDQ